MFVILTPSSHHDITAGGLEPYDVHETEFVMLAVRLSGSWLVSILTSRGNTENIDISVMNDATCATDI